MDLNMESKEIQRDRLWEYMEIHPEGITSIEGVYELKIIKTSTRISEMIRMGYPIIKIPEKEYDSRGKVTKRWMRYRKAA